MAKQKEPKRLRQGKGFHKGVQEAWHKDAAGEVRSEKRVTKPTGRGGRVDVLVEADQKLSAVVEIKASDWDAMRADAVRRNVRRQASQVWDYIESQLKLGKEVSPGVIFPKRPKDRRRLELVEQLFEEQGISVVWEDESIAKRKSRSGMVT